MDEIIKRKLTEEFVKLDYNIYGNYVDADFLRIDEFYEEVWDLNVNPEFLNGRIKVKDIRQHCVNNPEDWDLKYLLYRYFDLPHMNDDDFIKLLEFLVSPGVRSEDEVSKYVELINGYLAKAGEKLEIEEYKNTYPIYKYRKMDAGVSGSIRNLVFAVNGPKPKFVFKDMLSYEIEIKENAEFCLIYNEVTPKEGLMWGNLKEWWKNNNNLTLNDEEVSSNLLKRLEISIDAKISPPEFKVFDFYYGYFMGMLKEKLPVLIPQVYLHYDPVDAKNPNYIQYLERQRMDFLLLLPNSHRIVIEVDGQQHYSIKENGLHIASPKKYSEMVSVDREIRLKGYELYRFGGYELTSGNVEALLKEFFISLFKKHGVLPSK